MCGPQASTGLRFATLGRFFAPYAIRQRPFAWPPSRQDNISVDNTSEVLHPLFVTSQEFKRWLSKQGCSFEPGRGGHLTVRRGTRLSTLPMHGKQKELGTGLVKRIKKDLGLA